MRPHPPVLIIGLVLPRCATTELSTVFYTVNLPYMQQGLQLLIRLKLKTVVLKTCVPFACFRGEARLSYTYLNSCQKPVPLAWGKSNPIESLVHRVQQEGGGKRGNQRGQRQSRFFVRCYYIMRIHYQHSCNQSLVWNDWTATWINRSLCYSTIFNTSNSVWWNSLTFVKQRQCRYSIPHGCDVPPNKTFWRHLPS